MNAAAKLCTGESNDDRKIELIKNYVAGALDYDETLAENGDQTYIRDPAEILSRKTATCLDYAVVTAAMLRSQGIPVKVIFGYVSPNDLYHAWNMFYTEETGWVTVDYEVKADSWNRLDLTFSANGADGTFIGDGGNYRDLYLY